MATDVEVEELRGRLAARTRLTESGQGGGRLFRFPDRFRPHPPHRSTDHHGSRLLCPQSAQFVDQCRRGRHVAGCQGLLVAPAQRVHLAVVFLVHPRHPSTRGDDDGDGGVYLVRSAERPQRQGVSRLRP